MHSPLTSLFMPQMFLLQKFMEVITSPLERLTSPGNGRSILVPWQPLQTNPASVLLPKHPRESQHTREVSGCQLAACLPFHI
jgi:hypothetical protein